MEMVKRDGKTFVKINDYDKLRKLFGDLLREIQRIKSTGDFEAILSVRSLKYFIPKECEMYVILQSTSTRGVKVKSLDLQSD